MTKTSKTGSKTSSKKRPKKARDKKLADKHKRQQKAARRARRVEVKMRGRTSKKELDRIYAARRVVRIARHDVEVNYVHPEPEIRAHVVKATKVTAATKLANDARAAGYRVKIVEARGTTVPRWTVNAPDSKPNPGPPVHPSQYHGELVDSVGVYGKHDEHGAFKVWWHNGRAAGAGMRESGSGHWAETTATELTREIKLGIGLSMHEANSQKELLAAARKAKRAAG